MKSCCFLLFLILFSPLTTVAANFPLQIIQPQTGLGLSNRYYKAYPGIPYKVPVGIFGGLYPFSYSLTVSPSGMTIDPSTGIITWLTPPESTSPFSVTVRVVDSENSVATVSWSITVTRAGFLFIDSQNGVHALGFGCTANCGDGSLNRPFRSLVDVYRGTDYAAMNDTTYNDQFMYFRAGVYGLEGFLPISSDPQQYELEWRGNAKPVVWMSFPGEAVTIDHNFSPNSVHPSYTSDSGGAFIDFRNGNSDDTFIQGITFRDMRNHGFRLTNNRAVFFENHFENLGPGADGANSSFIMFSGREYGSSRNMYVRDNTFDTLNTGAFIKTYGLTYSVIENNRFSNPLGNILEGIALKHADQFVDVRSNSFDGNFRDGAINGNWNYDGNLEIRFNKILNSPVSYCDGCGVGLQINHDGLTNGPVFIHRNTIYGTVLLAAGVTGNGPISFYNNVVVNENSGTPAGSQITYTNVSDTTVFRAYDNLAGNIAANLIDSNGNLTGSFLSFLGTRGYQINANQPSTSTPPRRPNNLRVL